MVPQEIRDLLRQQPFEPFRLLMPDGVGYDIRHPNLLLVGERTAVVGLTGDPGKTFYERTVKVDLSHVVRLEPLESPSARPGSTDGDQR